MYLKLVQLILKTKSILDCLYKNFTWELIKLKLVLKKISLCKKNLELKIQPVL